MEINEMDGDGNDNMNGHGYDKKIKNKKNKIRKTFKYNSVFKIKSIIYYIINSSSLQIYKSLRSLWQ